jgi:hypothetical protein
VMTVFSNYCHIADSQPNSSSLKAFETIPRMMSFVELALLASLKFALLSFCFPLAQSGSTFRPVST